jgi:hypothetical protein
MHRTLILLLMTVLTSTVVVAGPGDEKSADRVAISTTIASHEMSLEAGKEQYWPYATSERRAWETRGYNQWGGHDLWCISPMYAICPLWSWKTIYPPDKETSDIPVETRCASYGDGLVRAAASEAGITLPPDLPFPDYLESGF